MVDGELVATDISHGLLTDYDDGLGNVWFSTCNNSVQFVEHQLFEICQAGYKDRKLVYDTEKRYDTDFSEGCQNLNVKNQVITTKCYRPPSLLLLIMGCDGSILCCAVVEARSL